MSYDDFDDIFGSSTPTPRQPSDAEGEANRDRDADVDDLFGSPSPTQPGAKPVGRDESPFGDPRPEPDFDPFGTVVAPSSPFADPEPEPFAEPEPVFEPEYVEPPQPVDMGSGYDEDDFYSPGAEGQSHGYAESTASPVWGSSSPFDGDDDYDDDYDDESSGRWRKVLGIAVAAAVVIGAGVWGVSGIGAGGQEDAAPVAKAPVVTPASITVKDWQGSGPATFAPEPLNTMKVSAASALAPTELGLVVINDRSLAVYDAGQRVSPVMRTKHDVKFVIATTINNQNVLAWRAGNALFFWSPQDPQSEPKSLYISGDATVSSAGKSLLIHLGDKTYVTNGAQYIPVTTPKRAASTEPMAYEGGDTILAAGNDPILWTMNVNGQNAESVRLEVPDLGTSLAKWVTAGHGKTVSLWRKGGDSRVTVAVHSAEDGSLLSKYITDAAGVANESWLRGEGLKYAALGPLLYDLETGDLLLDGAKQGIVFTRPFAKIAVGQTTDGPVIVQMDKTGHTAWKGGPEVVGADSEGNAIVRSADRTELSFHAAPR